MKQQRDNYRTFEVKPEATTKLNPTHKDENPPRNLETTYNSKGPEKNALE